MAELGRLRHRARGGQSAADAIKQASPGLDALVETERGCGPLPSGLTQPTAQIFVCDEPLRGPLAAPCSLLGRYDEAGEPVCYDRGCTGNRRGHDRKPREAGLDEHAWHPLALDDRCENTKTSAARISSATSSWRRAPSRHLNPQPPAPRRVRAARRRPGPHECRDRVVSALRPRMKRRSLGGSPVANGYQAHRATGWLLVPAVEISSDHARCAEGRVVLRVRRSPMRFVQSLRGDSGYEIGHEQKAAVKNPASAMLGGFGRGSDREKSTSRAPFADEGEVLEGAVSHARPRRRAGVRRGPYRA